MKKNLLLIVAALFVLQIQAQKIKITKGDLTPLKGETVIDINFTYDADLKVGKMSEDDYIAKKMAESDEREPGTAEKWKQMWYEDRSVHYEPKFIELLNHYSGDEVVFRPAIREANYIMVVNTVFIEPGFNVGVARKNASIDLEISFFPINDASNKIATIMIYGAPGHSMSFGDYDSGIRIGEAYAKAGKELGKFLTKKKVF